MVSSTSNHSAIRRLKKEYKDLLLYPVQFMHIEPLLDDWFEWHYVFRGPFRTPFEGGFYHGKIKFCDNYPFKPPSIMLLTPNGRFPINTQICVNLGDHQDDTWNPLWTVSTLLSAFVAFMLEKPDCTSDPDLVIPSDEIIVEFAQKSLEYNLKNPKFSVLFPKITIELRERTSGRLNVPFSSERPISNNETETATETGFPQNQSGNMEQLEIEEPRNRDIVDKIRFYLNLTCCIMFVIGLILTILILCNKL